MSIALPGFSLVIKYYVTSKLPPLFDANFRSKFEAEVVYDLITRDPSFKYEDHYEAVRIPYTIPAHEAQYTPDLFFADFNLAIEMKGWFRDSDTRRKYLHFAESNPHITLRFVLQRPNVKIYRGSKTTQEAWLRKHGFEVAFGTIPAEWLTNPSST